MELRESIDSINDNLKKEYGLADNSQPNFRVVFSEDQYEKRWTDKTDEGFQLLNPEVRLLPKYKQYIEQKYILERLVPVVEGSDLTTKTSYEPAWVFQTKNLEYLPPRFDMCAFVIDSIYAAMDKAGTHVKYRDTSLSEEERTKRLAEMEAELFGNETNLTDDLHYGSGVGYTGPGLKEVQINPETTLNRLIGIPDKLVH